ncbi:MAG: hypothetical protein M3R50_07810, partial [Bacteroidota bacterium]|nr:hypothetical protein [Bacteroidota bacterium]
YVKSTSDSKLLLKEVSDIRLVDRLELAFKVPPARQDNDIVNTNLSFRGVDFGFRDAIEITGDLSFASILKYRAANELAEMFQQLGNKEKVKKYHQIALRIKQALPLIFLNKDGMLLASTGISAQPDVWATAFAINLQLLEGDNLLKACQHLASAYKNGTLSFKGNIRHILTSDDYSDKTAWESAIVEKNQYQNGAYWGTPLGWVAFAISRVDSISARQLVKEYINDLRENDFRKGSKFGAPLECFYPPAYTRGPVYLATVSCPYIAFKSLQPVQKLKKF